VVEGGGEELVLGSQEGDAVERAAGEVVGDLAAELAT